MVKSMNSLLHIDNNTQRRKKKKASAVINDCSPVAFHSSKRYFCVMETSVAFIEIQ